ncbi:hypothetical protein SAMN05444354_112142 [Stigmatella aurantiaca]|uniref:Uncharacterized protein n=1 Tax=Stigmatella aurantiaca TaxID=41 RepID=A0A1H7W3W2_STIAU|nr:hypothetical protein [Stigmatella aurantiaca]SEM16226.1 hypothetical protein SAMN05444354_112142 [Stigmatella aurantiaca]
MATKTRRAFTSKKPGLREPSTPPLVLGRKAFRQSMVALFQDLDTDEKAQQRFIQDPAGIIMDRVFQEKLPPQRASEANRLLFSVLANKRFFRWMDQYANENKGRRVGKDEFNQDFAKALLEFGDHELLLSVVSNASTGFGIPGMGDRAQQILINNAAGTAVATPVNSPSTSDQTLRSSQNFNGLGFGDLGQLVNPAILRSISEQLLARAQELKDVGALADLSVQIR